MRFIWTGRYSLTPYRFHFDRRVVWLGAFAAHFTTGSHSSAANERRGGAGLSPRFAGVGAGLLVIGQVALSVVLLIGAALLMRSVLHLRRVEVGFNPANLLTVRVSLPLARYDADQKKTAFFEDLVSRVESLPGVHSATAAMFLPMTGYIGSPVQDAGKTPLKLNERPLATMLIVAPDYFRTLEIPLRRGRDFALQDDTNDTTCGYYR